MVLRFRLSVGLLNCCLTFYCTYALWACCRFYQLVWLIWTMASLVRWEGASLALGWWTTALYAACFAWQADSIFFSSLVWHLARMCFVQVGRLERCCLHGLHCDSSDMDDALWMCIILLIQDMLLTSASWLAVDNTFLWGCYRCIRVMNISPSQPKKKKNKESPVISRSTQLTGERCNMLKEHVVKR